MVKVAAPCLSLAASGSIAGAMTFGTWKGRPYVRQLVKPSNPRSGGQVGVRSMLKFLSQDWTNLTAAAKATWEDLADDKVISPFNAYIGFNQARFRNFNAPSKEPSALEVQPLGTIANEAATAGIRQILIEFDLTASGNNWGCLVFRQTTTPVVTAWTNLVHIVKAASIASFTWIDTPLAAGHYYYNFRLFTIDGKLGPEATEVDDTVV